MLGMTNAQTYWPEFCRAIDRPELQDNPKFADFDARQKNCVELITIIEEIFKSKTYAEWLAHLGKFKLVWSPVVTPLEVPMTSRRSPTTFSAMDIAGHGKSRCSTTPSSLRDPGRHQVPRAGTG
jgi:crotonobetainyl-CoA:carnitine CoA-transferase CaiB-like acyl-CoA transferase